MTSKLPQLTVLADRAALYWNAFTGLGCLNHVFFKSRWDGLEGSYRKYWLCAGLCVLRYVPDSRRDGAKWNELIVSVMKYSCHDMLCFRHVSHMLTNDLVNTISMLYIVFSRIKCTAYQTYQIISENERDNLFCLISGSQLQYFQGLSR